MVNYTDVGHINQADIKFAKLTKLYNTQKNPKNGVFVIHILI
jgi:hypothetical protein